MGLVHSDYNGPRMPGRTATEVAPDANEALRTAHCAGMDWLNAKKGCLRASEVRAEMLLFLSFVYGYFKPIGVDRAEGAHL